jgi:hypothetical protein
VVSAALYPAPPRDQPNRSVPGPLEKALAYLLLPAMGALVAHTHTTAPGRGPFGIVHVAEAPIAEVAGARATGDAGVAPSVDPALLPPGAVVAVPEAAAQVRLTAAGGVITTPDGIQLRLPTGPVAAVASVPGAGGEALAIRSVQTVPPAGGSEGVAGIADPPQPEAPPAAEPSADLALSYRPIAVPAPRGPAPRVLRAFALTAATGVAAADSQAAQPVARFFQPLTVTVPYDPEADVTGWLSLAIFEPDPKAASSTAGGTGGAGTTGATSAAGGTWVELPMRAVSGQRATVSAQTFRPGVIALIENRPPVPLADAAQTIAGVPVTVDVLANDADPDGDSLAVFERTTASAAGGEVRCAQTACVYTPPASFAGTDTFTYGVGDHRPGTNAWTDNAAESNVTVLVRPVGR